MSTGHLHGEKKSEAELYELLGEGDTPKLYARKVHLDTLHDIPYAGGNSVDGKTVYIDRRLFEKIKSGQLTVKGMSGDQIIQAWVEHEHTEKAIDDGDNPVDVYLGAHAYATAKEEDFVKKLGVDPERYEAAIKPALESCQARDPRNPPKDLWCSPYLDMPDERGRELIRILKSKGVVDATKESKRASNYRMGEHECADCVHFAGGKLNTCEKVCGLVRWDRQCDNYKERKDG